MCYTSALVLKYCTHIANSQGKIMKTFVTNIANCGNICDKYCAHYLAFTSLLTELHYNHLHWPCLQISAISLSQISGPAQAIRDCLSDRNTLSLSDNKQSFLTENLCSAKFSQSQSQFKYPTKWHLKNAPISPEIKRSHNLHLELPLYLWN